MPELRPVEVKYRNQMVRGEWYVVGGCVHVTSTLGNLSGAVARPSMTIVSPSQIAARLLWKIARKADPRRPFFFWR